MSDEPKISIRVSDGIPSGMVVLTYKTCVLAVWTVTHLRERGLPELCDTIHYSFADISLDKVQRVILEIA